MRFKYFTKGNKSYYLDSKVDFGNKFLPSIFNIKGVKFKAYEVTGKIIPSKHRRRVKLIYDILLYLSLGSFPIMYILNDSNKMASSSLHIQVIVATLVALISLSLMNKTDNIDEQAIIHKKNKGLSVKVSFKDNTIRLGLLVCYVMLIIATIALLGVTIIFWNSITNNYFNVIMGPLLLIACVFFYFQMFYRFYELEYQFVKKDLN